MRSFRFWVSSIALVLPVVMAFSAAPAASVGGASLTPIAQGLSAPVGLAVDDQGTLYVAEAGARPETTPRIVRVKGKKQQAISQFPAPLTGLTWHRDRLYASMVGAIAEVSPSGATHVLVTDLPSHGDHPNSALALGPDGFLYFGQGTATNAGIVGPDNQWVKDYPQGHDIPCRTVTLRGPNFSAQETKGGTPPETAPIGVATGAFLPFGKPSARGQVVVGRVPCSGAVLRVRPNGSGMALVAWGLRDPRSLAFTSEGTLYAAVRGMEERGSRPVAGDRDHLYRIESGTWYGWPDFAGGQQALQKGNTPAPVLLADPPQQPPKPIASFPKEAGLQALLIPPSAANLGGDALAAFVGRVGEPGKVLRVNLSSGAATPFLAPVPEGAAQTVPTHPTALAVGRGGEIYIADYGAIDEHGPVQSAGVIWRLTPERPREQRGVRSIPWNWALCGLVLAIAGSRLVVRD